MLLLLLFLCSPRNCFFGWNSFQIGAFYCFVLCWLFVLCCADQVSGGSSSAMLHRLLACAGFVLSFSVHVLCLVDIQQCYTALPFAFWLGLAPHHGFGSLFNQCQLLFFVLFSLFYDGLDVNVLTGSLFPFVYPCIWTCWFSSLVYFFIFLYTYILIKKKSTPS